MFYIVFMVYIIIMVLIFMIRYLGYLFRIFYDKNSNWALEIRLLNELLRFIEN